MGSLIQKAKRDACFEGKKTEVQKVVEEVTKHVSLVRALVAELKETKEGTPTSELEADTTRIDDLVQKSDTHLGGWKAMKKRVADLIA